MDLPSRRIERKADSKDPVRLFSQPFPEKTARYTAVGLSASACCDELYGVSKQWLLT